MRLFDMIMIGARKPPHVVGRWVLRKLKSRRTAKTLPRWQRWLGPSTMAAALDAEDFESLVRDLDNANPFPGLSKPKSIRQHLNDNERAAINDKADRARRYEVDLLGSGPTVIGPDIDWATDFKSNVRWPMRASRQLPVNEPNAPSDIKVPWELSRLQWLLPVGQRYLLDGKEADAVFAREVIEHWMVKNPVCAGPNWMCAMDVSLRAISMVWLFHACKSSKAWRDKEFRERFVKSLILHGYFVNGNLEYADVNGNHLIADLAGLTVVGVALGGKALAGKWVKASWRILTEEFPTQVPEDGVCREASAPYHRLVAELFCLPALARMNVGLPVDDAYLTKLKDMARFIEAVTGPDNCVPVWGDADDGRALPLGNQAINDHRYLAEILKHLKNAPVRPKHAETAWWIGAGSGKAAAPETGSADFKDAGAYVLRNKESVVFIDAGPVGMDGRGGHGHNDCLSIDVCLAGKRLLVDPGSFVYTADADARNRFRSTSAHNTPQVDDEEINRFVRPEYLWLLRDDAQPTVRNWNIDGSMEVLIASHSGYQRLPEPVVPVRTVLFDREHHRVIVQDRFEGSGDHNVRIPLTFAPDVDIQHIDGETWRLQADNESFLLAFDAPGWEISRVDAEVSPTYGVRHAANGIELTCQGQLQEISLVIAPDIGSGFDPFAWMRSRLSQR